MEQLESLAESEGITIINAPLPHIKAGMIKDSGIIAIDLRKIKNSTEYAEILAHELGHYFTGAYYTINSPLRCESRANGWAIKKLLPAENIREALHKGLRSYREIAEDTGRTGTFVKKAIRHYTRKRAKEAL